MRFIRICTEAVFGRNVPSPQHLLTLLPIGLLIAIAITQRITITTAQITPWKGGGFGMFSTVDGLTERSISFVAQTADGPIALSHSVPFDQMMNALSLPSDTRLADLYTTVRDDLRVFGTCNPCDLQADLGATSVEVQVWTLQYNADEKQIVPTLLKQLTIEVVD